MSPVATLQTLNAILANSFNNLCLFIGDSGHLAPTMAILCPLVLQLSNGYHTLALLYHYPQYGYFKLQLEFVLPTWDDKFTGTPRRAMHDCRRLL